MIDEIRSILKQELSEVHHLGKHIFVYRILLHMLNNILWRLLHLFHTDPNFWGIGNRNLNKASESLLRAWHLENESSNDLYSTFVSAVLQQCTTYLLFLMEIQIMLSSLRLSSIVIDSLKRASYSSFLRRENQFILDDYLSREKCKCRF